MAPLSKLQRDQVDQQAQQQQVKQRKAVNAVKKLTKSVYERINPVVDSRSPHPDLLPKDKGQTPNLPLPMGEGWGEGASSIKNLPALPDETIQSNQRLADSIKRRIDVGDLPRFTADAINTDATKAIPEIIDLIHNVEDPAQAREPYQRTLQGITPENQRRLEQNYALSLSGGEDKDRETSQQENNNLIKDWNVNHRKVVDDDATEPLNVTIRSNADNEIDLMDGASGLHGKDFDAQKKLPVWLMIWAEFWTPINRSPLRMRMQ